MRTVGVLLLLLTVVGCATTGGLATRIDGATLETFRVSWSRLNSALSEHQQAQLDTAILIIGATKLRESGFKGPAGFGPGTLCAKLDGKRFDDILAAAKATGAKVSVNPGHAT